MVGVFQVRGQFGYYGLENLIKEGRDLFCRAGAG